MPGVSPIAEPGPDGEGPERTGLRRGGAPRRDRPAARRSPLCHLAPHGCPRKTADPGQSGGQHFRVRHGFVAIGAVLRAFGISVTAYLASASIIGLAVGFGSQGLVQDVVTGLTVVFSHLFAVGDMVKIGGQTGIVQELGMRFTILTNFTGARVFIPNRPIANVVTYPRGYVRALPDVNLPAAPEAAARAEEIAGLAIQSAHEQFPGIPVTSPGAAGRFRTSSGKEYQRGKFRIWPGQGGPLEARVRPGLVESLGALDPAYADWMVGIRYEVEQKTGGPPSQSVPYPGKPTPRDGAARSRQR